MTLSRRVRHAAAAAALFAMLLSALAPAVSHALALQRAGGPVAAADYCRTGGAMPGAPARETGQPHCPFCLAAGAGDAITGAKGEMRVPVAEAEAPAASGRESPGTAFAALPSLPRGPPAHA